MNHNAEHRMTLSGTRLYDEECAACCTGSTQDVKIKIDHNEITDTSFYSISGRMAVLIEEALWRGRIILHTSICADAQSRFYGSIIWRGK